MLGCFGTLDKRSRELTESLLACGRVLVLGSRFYAILSTRRFLHTRKRDASLLSFDNAGSPAIYVEHIVGKAVAPL